MTEGAYRVNYLFGDILLLICGYVISRPVLRSAVLTVGVQCLFYAVTLETTEIFTGEGKLVSLLFCISGGVVTIMTALALEQTSRRAFLLSQELNRMAKTDPLTALGNRRRFEDATGAFWCTSATSVNLASLILIDIDKFKIFNDSYGHPAGDVCLATIARCITGQMRDERDLAVRFGGEEMIVFLPDTDFTQARQIAERIRLAIISVSIPHPALADGAVVTASFGVATAPTTHCTVAELVIRTDMELYAAKKAGRNQVWPPIGSLPEQFWRQPPVAEPAAKRVKAA